MTMMIAANTTSKLNTLKEEELLLFTCVISIFVLVKLTLISVWTKFLLYY